VDPFSRSLALSTIVATRRKEEHTMDDTIPAPDPSVPNVPEPKGGIPKAVWLVVGAVLVAGIAVAGAIILTSRGGGESTSDEPPPKRVYKIAGTLSAPECGGGYDIENSSVQIRDQNDKLIGSASTGLDEDYTIGCSVSFEIEVPKAAFYQTTIGTHGGPSYSFAEMGANNWKLELSLD
jgi:hypothetical protein